MRILVSFSIILLFFSGCSTSKYIPFSGYSDKPQTYEEYKAKVLEETRDGDYNKPYANTDGIYQNLNGAILAIADQLLTSNVKKQANTRIVLTSLVQLSEFNKTTSFGRIVSESLFNELHIRRFNVTDFRGQDAIVVNANGEFHITRDTGKLKNQIENSEYILVGTYARFEEDSVLINARIMDSLTGELISSARIIYAPKDCKLFGICATTRTAVKIKIIADDCAANNRCSKQQCKSGVCNNLVSK